MLRSEMTTSFGNRLLRNSLSLFPHGSTSVKESIRIRVIIIPVPKY